MGISSKQTTILLRFPENQVTAEIAAVFAFETAVGGEAEIILRDVLKIDGVEILNPEVIRRKLNFACRNPAVVDDDVVLKNFSGFG